MELDNLIRIQLSCVPAMENSKVLFSIFLISSSFFLLLPPYSCVANELKACGIDAVYLFGESTLDTGNSIVEVPGAYHSRFPFGQTIHKATGRPSDGLLVIDYIAKSAGLPPVDAFLNRNATHFSRGVSFAVGGVTALSAKDLAKRNIKPGWSNSSMIVQLGWWDTYLKGFCHDAQECRQKLKSALFTISFGANDYYLAFSQNRTVEEVKRQLVPLVMRTVMKGIEKLINYGARRVFVPGYHPFGCTPGYLTEFAANNSTGYDKFGCLNSYNDFYKYHNARLQKHLEKLRKKRPNVQIVYGDTYNALQSVLIDHQKLGIKSVTKTCCGIGGQYNFTVDWRKWCGATGVPFCLDPEHYIFWDGFHFTQHAGMLLSRFLIGDIVSGLQCKA